MRFLLFPSIQGLRFLSKSILRINMFFCLCSCFTFNFTSFFTEDTTCCFQHCRTSCCERPRLLQPLRFWNTKKTQKAESAVSMLLSGWLKTHLCTQDYKADLKLALALCVLHCAFVFCRLPFADLQCLFTASLPCSSCEP